MEVRTSFIEIIRGEKNRGKIGLGVLVRVKTAFQMIEICQMNRLIATQMITAPTLNAHKSQGDESD